MSEPCPKCLLWHRPDRPEWTCPATPDLTPFDLAELVAAGRGSSAAAVDVARELLRWRPVIEAVQLWRHGLVEVGARLLDSDDGSAEPGMKRPAAVRVLVDAIDTARAKGGK